MVGIDIKKISINIRKKYLIFLNRGIFFKVIRKHPNLLKVIFALSSNLINKTQNRQQISQQNIFINQLTALANSSNHRSDL